MASPRQVFITGATGYLGGRLATHLVGRGHQVKALARMGSEHKLPPGCRSVIGNALDHESYGHEVEPSDIFVHLVGVSHPSPAKAKEFRTVDLASAHQAVQAATAALVSHFVYVSVAHPAPVMTAYWTARVEAEQVIRDAGLNATILRPWYALGPGHRWPVILLPLYWVADRIPATRASAQRLGLVSHRQMIDALVWSVENPARGTRVLAVPDIRDGRRGSL